MYNIFSYVVNYFLHFVSFFYNIRKFLFTFVCLLIFLPSSMFFISMIVHAFSNGFTDVLLLYRHLSEELARFLLYNYDKINAYLLKLHAGPGIRPKGSNRSTAIITVITIIKKRRKRSRYRLPQHQKWEKRSTRKKALKCLMCLSYCSSSCSW